MAQNEGKLIVATRFSCIYQSGSTVTKVTPIGSVVRPHDPLSELELLRRLQISKNLHIIELLSFDTQQGTVRLQFPYYRQNMHEYLMTYYRRPRWNPYLLNGEQSQSSKRVNGLPLTHAISFFQQLADALTSIHALGIIHRDLKLHNVLVDEADAQNATPRLILIDFGIAYHEETSSEAPDHKVTDVSTSIYKAPELLFSVKNYSSAIDIWALLVLISQVFNMDSLSDTHIPAFVDDGSGELEQGSDIRLISSIFENLGIPTLDEWPEVRDHGSPAFEGMFGREGNNRYFVSQPIQVQHKMCLRLFPRLVEISEPAKTTLIRCLLRMMPFESTHRISAIEISELLKSLHDKQVERTAH
ncbi:LADA_0C11188g1_1 [Lachancea dasiensis]|uniref:LADA_0C11188g1_1 n=1 Tax=Lachancea dasiensis TaxID=1072105 RepID=A0A1G4J196_9SACH|nr:LADA_0C11188g1_1 [Lachancea dasiensis]